MGKLAPVAEHKGQESSLVVSSAEVSSALAAEVGWWSERGGASDGEAALRGMRERAGERLCVKWGHSWDLPLEMHLGSKGMGW